MFKFALSFILLSILVGMIQGCSHRPIKAVNSIRTEIIKSNYSSGDLKNLCDNALKTVRLDIESLMEALSKKQVPLNFTHTFKTLDLIIYNFRDTVEPLNFMAYVSKNKSIRDEGIECEEKMNQFLVELYTNKNLYDLIKDVKPDPKEPLSARLIQEYKRDFEQNGMKLSSKNLEEFKKLKTELSGLEAKFSKNLNEDTTFVTLTQKQLEGAPESFISRLKKDPQGNFIVTTKRTDYAQIEDNVKDPEVRKLVLQKYNQRGGLENIELLKRALIIRQKLAKLMGYKTWADYQTQDRMAKNAKNVWNFYSKLKRKLVAKNKQDLELLLKAKQKMENPKSSKLETWDVAYFANQVKKTELNIDDEKIREYFPKDFVMSGMFDVYAILFDVTFEEIESAKVWSNDVKMYVVKDQTTKKVLSYFYTDFVPREGKYGHAAAFTLQNGRKLPDGSYQQPVAAIVANFNPPSNGKPALLNHDEVETLFHEFGHIMHQILTQSPYGLLSGTNVAQDFVEAPSQMLEGWVWDPKILEKISGHYKDTNQKLPADMIKRMVDAKNFNQGYFYARQLYLGSMDLALHTQKGAVDILAVNKNTYRNILALEPVEGDLFPSSFGHLMGGYDAGYYGYLWSEVFAADMLSEFEKQGMLNSDLGYKYRKYILESGSNEDALILVEKFLGRKSNPNAFYKKLN